MLTVERKITVADVCIGIATNKGIIDKLVRIPLCESEETRLQSRLAQFPELYREGLLVNAEIQCFKKIHLSMPVLQFLKEADNLSEKTLHVFD